MAKASTGQGAKRSGPTSRGKAAKPRASASKTPARASGRGSGAGKSSDTNGAADALIKLIESPLVAELLAIGASAALASLAAQRFGRSEDGKGTRRALKTAAKSAAAAMGQRISTEVEEIRKAAKDVRAREEA